jgi:hypothetical protein
MVATSTDRHEDGDDDQAGRPARRSCSGRAKILGNMPSVRCPPGPGLSDEEHPAAERADGFQHLRQTANDRSAPVAPIAMRAASANGACGGACSSSFGQPPNPWMTVEAQADYTTAANGAQPRMSVASGQRCGSEFSNHARRNRGALDAHVGPQRHRSGAATPHGMSDSPLTFQPARNHLRVEPQPAEDRDRENRDSAPAPSSRFRARR